MNKIIYVGLIASSFFVGQYFPHKKEIDTIKQGQEWFISYSDKKYPIKILGLKPQIGDTYYRMRGLLEEKVVDLKYTLDKIKEEDYDSN